MNAVSGADWCFEFLVVVGCFVGWLLFTLVGWVLHVCGVAVVLAMCFSFF